MAKKKESAYYTPEWDEWDVEEYQEKEEIFPAHKRKTKKQIFEEIEEEKKNQTKTDTPEAPSFSFSSEHSLDHSFEPSFEDSSLDTILQNPYQKPKEKSDSFSELYAAPPVAEKEIQEKSSKFSFKKRKEPELETEDPFYEDDIYEDESQGSGILRIFLLIFSILLGIVGLGVFGYFNTDFDSHGQTYIIPMDIRYERKYVLKSDQLLNLLLTIDATLEEDAKSLPENPVEITTKLNTTLEQLEKATNDLSKYVGVPTKFSTYHKTLINFSLNLQSFIENLMNKYSTDTYSEFMLAGLADYESSFEQVKQERIEMDTIVFRNMGDASTLETDNQEEDK